MRVTGQHYLMDLCSTRQNRRDSRRTDAGAHVADKVHPTGHRITFFPGYSEELRQFAEMLRNME